MEWVWVGRVLKGRRWGGFELGGSLKVTDPQDVWEGSLKVIEQRNDWVGKDLMAPPAPPPLFPTLHFALQSVEVISHRGYFGRRSRRKEPEPPAPPEPPWVHFCDFQEITHIVIEERRVSVHRQDNKCMVSAAVGRGGGCTLLGFLGRDWMDLGLLGCGRWKRPIGFGLSQGLTNG